MLSFFTYIRNDSISSIFAVSPTTISYKYINYKINNTSIFKTNLPSLTTATLLYSFRRFLALRKVLQNLAKIQLARNVCYFAVVNAVVIMQISKLTNQCSLFTTVRYIFWDQWGWPPMNGEPCAHDIWRTLDFASAFLSPGVNSRAELVPSHGASRRRLGEYNYLENHVSHNELWSN
jgi:hypothetical protein